MDKIHQIYPLEKFLKDVKRHFKLKDKYLKAQERLNIPLEKFQRMLNGFLSQKINILRLKNA